MKSIIYLDNFRGFQDTWIPLRKVNFFVGENSTGKSTVLHVINLLSDSQFWFNQDLGIINPEFTFFNDTISKNSNNKRTFTIGIGKCTDKINTTTPAVEVAIITFENFNGKPVAKKFTFLNDHVAATFIFGNKQAKFKSFDADQFICPGEDIICIESLFRSILHAHNTESEGFKLMKGYQRIPRELALFFAKSIILTEDKDAGYERVLIASSFFSNIASFDPIRSKPKRTYDGNKDSFTSSGEHTPHLIRTLLTNKKNKDFRTLLEFFGKESGLFDSILPKNFGKGAYSPFELNIVSNDQTFRVNSVGYGVSQVLPIVTEIIARTSPATYIIQQPEVHLHPRAQAAFGELIHKIYTASNRDDKNTVFFIETHSDYLIDRYRLSVSRSDSHIESHVVFFNKKGYSIHAQSIKINSDGTYCKDQPVEFKHFFLKEEMSLLSI